MGYMLDLDELSTETLERELAARRADQANGLCDYCHYPAGYPLVWFKDGVPTWPASRGEKGPSPSCRFPDRHGFDESKVARVTTWLADYFSRKEQTDNE